MHSNTIPEKALARLITMKSESRRDTHDQRQSILRLEHSGRVQTSSGVGFKESTALELQLVYSWATECRGLSLSLAETGKGFLFVV